MADYWKSQGRKFCDFCKCWIADNKPGIESHEGGRKHKENVAKRLKEIHKNSAKQHKIAKKFENDLKNMENAAKAAYLKDIDGNTVDLTAQQIIQDKQNRLEQKTSILSNPNRMPDAAPETNPRHKLSKNLPSNVDFCNPMTFYRAAREPQTRPVNVPAGTSGEIKAQEKSRERGKGKRGQNVEIKKKAVRKAWYEALSPEGYTYYWHIDTNERTWDPPEEGFMTFAEQEEEVKEQAIQAELLEQLEEEEAREKADILEEQRACVEREKLRELRDGGKRHFTNEPPLNPADVSQQSYKQEDLNENQAIVYRKDYSIPERIDPYGPWQTVEITPKKVVDLQLPKKTSIPIVQPIIPEPVPQRVFVEKTVTKISTGDSDDGGEEFALKTTFKKRKLGNKNVRKRFEDD